MMATDSIRTLKNEYVERLHSHRGPVGKLYKGQAVTAEHASIPSQYQTFVIDNSEKKGFLSNAKRFSYDLHESDLPGPGSYVGVSAMESNSVSFSKRGTGMMASKDSRIQKPHVTSTPGPNTYNTSLPAMSKHDFSRSTVSSAFQAPIALQRPRSTGPAPNQYNVKDSRSGRSNNVCANAAFKSQTKRDILAVGDSLNKPSPCQYNVNDSGVRENVHVPLSSFKSKTSRMFPPTSSNMPGPGQYKPFEPSDPVKRTVFPRHNYLCLSAPAMPLPASPQPPGPASYSIPRSFGAASKSESNSAAFASTTSRWSLETKTISSDFPGPAHYNPSKVGKQSFLYNANSRWL